MILEGRESETVENLLPWDQDVIFYNPECSQCVYSSYGKGCNLKSMDKEELFICSKQIIPPFKHQKVCFGCEEMIETGFEGFEIVNPHNTTQTKWICLRGWRMAEMACFVNRKLYFLLKNHNHRFEPHTFEFKRLNLM